MNNSLIRSRPILMYGSETNLRGVKITSRNILSVSNYLKKTNQFQNCDVFYSLQDKQMLFLERESFNPVYTLPQMFLFIGDILMWKDTEAGRYFYRVDVLRNFDKIHGQVFKIDYGRTSNE